MDRIVTANAYDQILSYDFTRWERMGVQPEEIAAWAVPEEHEADFRAFVGFSGILTAFHWRTCTIGEFACVDSTLPALAACDRESRRLGGRPV